jgi:hypothetical protein
VADVDPGEKVTGIVRTIGGQPVAQAKVTVYGEKCLTLTDVAGRFELNVPSGKESSIVADSPGFFSRSKVFRPEEPEVVELWLVPEAVLAGTVIDAETSTPIPRASVVIQGRRYDADEVPHGDEKGRFELGKLSAGKWSLRACAEKYAAGVSGPIQVQAGDRVIDIVIALKKGAILNGLVLDAKSGEAIAQAQVYMDPSEESIASTDEAGAFTVQGLEEGGHEIWCKAPGFLESGRQKTSISRDRENRVELFLERGASISGVVYDAAGRPDPRT